MGRVEINEKLVGLLTESKEEMKGFSKKSYDDKFDNLIHKYGSAFKELKNLYQEENENQEILREFAEVFPKTAVAEIESLKKRHRQVTSIDYNMAMVTFVLPVITSDKDEVMTLFAELCVEEWNKAFPKQRIQSSSKEAITGGFRNGICYVTTAVCDNLQKPDDCYELNLLRNFRDTYLTNEAADGVELIEKYYDVAPTIVKRINRDENCDQVYGEIWSEYLQPCIQLIEEGSLEESKDLYAYMVEQLSVKYFH